MTIRRLHPDQPAAFAFTPANAEWAPALPIAPPSPARGGVGGGVTGRGRVMPRFTRKPHHTALARRLRKDPTDAERVLWLRLRNRQPGVAFRRQHPVFGYVDFYAPEARLAVEIDGGQHAEPTSVERARTAAIHGRGIAILRFWNHEVLTDIEGVLQTIVLVLSHLRGATPTPTLPLAGGGGAAEPALPEGLRFSLPKES